MQVLVLSADAVHQLLGYPDCVEAMRGAFAALAAGRAEQPLRTVIHPSGAPGLIGLMPGYLVGDSPEESSYGLKALVVSPANPGLGLDSHLGLVILSDGQTGEPRALLNASAVTTIRTAAVSVLATELLARPEAATLAIIGTGAQAQAHALAFSQCRPLDSIRIAGRTQAKAQDLAADLRPRLDVDIAASPSVQDAVTGADIIVTVTSSARPVLRRDWIAAGAHLNAVGASQPAAREIDGATVAAAALFADSRESLEAESGDYLEARAEGLIGPDHLRAELGAVLSGAAPGRTSDTEITMFESLGLAVQDLAAARSACAAAERAGAGQWVTF
jgi:ornithine cyclodeaminase/alanine dehydrogenase-like protein (mu-crystallin family)